MCGLVLDEPACPRLPPACSLTWRAWQIACRCCKTCRIDCTTAPSDRGQLSAIPYPCKGDSPKSRRQVTGTEFARPTIPKLDVSARNPNVHTSEKEIVMNIVWLVGAVVIVLAILSFFGLR